MSHVEAQVSDSNPPQASIGGSLTQGGDWLRGDQTFAAAGHDGGSGVSLVNATVNDTYVLWSPPTCPTATSTWPYVTQGRPCPVNHAPAAQTFDTSKAPFQNGCENVIRAAAQDYTGTWSAVAERSGICIDNAAPGLAFANQEDPDDPELIRAPVSDPHSGLNAGSAAIALRQVGTEDWTGLPTAVRNGALEARVDSAAYPAGEYQLRAAASDVAGNQAVTTRRANGDPMRLTFPLRYGAELSAHLEPSGAKHQTIAYGRKAFVAGRLRDGEGEPLAGKTVRVVEHFGDGALIRERVSDVQTDAQGRWSSKLPPGPSRRVTARFAGTPKYLPEQAGAGDLGVKSRTNLKPSRERVPEGEGVVFRGKVGRKGARIPVGGKLVELQVRIDRGRWDTVKRPIYTSSRGKWRLRYRFGDFYTRNVGYQFRARVLRESDWPYKAARSKKRRVVVIAR